MPNTLKAYNIYEKKWATFCKLRNINPYKPAEREILNFLAGLADKGLSYQSVNSARSALSAFLPLIRNKRVGQSDNVCWLLKGIRNKNPPLARWNATWDVDVLLDFLREWSPLARLTLKQLTQKLVCLLLITSCQRVQTVTALKLSEKIEGTEDVVFRLTTRLKHNTRGTLSLIQFKPFKEDKKICVVSAIKEYMDRTSDVRGNKDQLILSYAPPYDPVSSASVSRWVREVLGSAGIGPSVFTTHSIRGAVTSQMLRINVPVKDILAKASWRSESSFRKYYNKPFIDEDPSQELLHAYRNTRLARGAVT